MRLPLRILLLGVACLALIGCGLRSRISPPPPTPTALPRAEEALEPVARAVLGDQLRSVRVVPVDVGTIQGALQGTPVATDSPSRPSATDKRYGVIDYDVRPDQDTPAIILSAVANLRSIAPRALQTDLDLLELRSFGPARAADGSLTRVVAVEFIVPSQGRSIDWTNLQPADIEPTIRSAGGAVVVNPALRPTWDSYQAGLISPTPSPVAGR